MLLTSKQGAACTSVFTSTLWSPCHGSKQAEGSRGSRHLAATPAQASPAVLLTLSAVMILASSSLFSIISSYHLRRRTLLSCQETRAAAAVALARDERLRGGRGQTPAADPPPAGAGVCVCAYGRPPPAPTSPPRPPPAPGGTGSGASPGAPLAAPRAPYSAAAHLGGEAAPGGAGFVRGSHGRPRLGRPAVGHPGQLLAAGRVMHGESGGRLQPAAAHQAAPAHQGAGRRPAAAPHRRRRTRGRRGEKEEAAGGGGGGSPPRQEARHGRALATGGGARADPARTAPEEEQLRRGRARSGLSPGHGGRRAGSGGWSPPAAVGAFPGECCCLPEPRFPSPIESPSERPASGGSARGGCGRPGPVPSPLAPVVVGLWRQGHATRRSRCHHLGWGPAWLCRVYQPGPQGEQGPGAAAGPGLPGGWPGAAAGPPRGEAAEHSGAGGRSSLAVSPSLLVLSVRCAVGSPEPVNSCSYEKG